MLQLDYAYTRHAHRRGSRPHMTAVTLVGAVHVAFAFVLINALTNPEVTKFSGTSVTGVKVDDDDLPLKPPDPPVAYVPPPVPAPPVPDVTIRTPPPAQRNTITEERVAEPPGNDIAPPPPTRTLPRAIVETQTGPTYPAISRRLREEGAVRLRLTIGTDGSVVAAEVLESSGYMRLDDAALNWVTRRWHYEPAMEGTTPVESTAEATLIFKLE
jgi:TonB family protein